MCGDDISQTGYFGDGESSSSGSDVATGFTSDDDSERNGSSKGKGIQDTQFSQFLLVICKNQ